VTDLADEPVDESREDPVDEPVDEREPLADAADETAGLRRARRRSITLAFGLLAVALAIGVPVAASPRHPWFQPIDDSWRTWIEHHRTAAMTDVSRVLNVVGSVVVTLPLRILAVAVLALRRRWVQLSAFVVAVVSSEIAIGVVKGLIERPRPLHALVTTSGTSFPSGHAIATAVTAFGLVAAFLPRGRRRWHWFVAASFLAASMSWSRTYLDAHWATDTIAGTAIGVALALLSEALFEGGRHAVATRLEATDGVTDPPERSLGSGPRRPDPG
jgi:undecaprenyl-diphosphatase